MRTALVGRERELAALSDCLEDALFGQPRLVVCRGEPGIGKTRLAQEVCSSAADRDVVTVWGRADDSAGAPPYWPWRQILRAMSAVVDVSAIAQEHRLATDLSLVAPDLFAEAVDHPLSSTSIAARFRQFDAVGDLLRQVTRRRALVIVLDDAHWADPSSLLLLRHLVRNLTDERLLLIVNQRDTGFGHGVLVTELLREPVSRQLDLRGLPVSAVGRQLAGVVGRDVSAAESEQVHSVTGGNPFFIAEMGRVLAERYAGGSRPPVTASVRDAITARLNRLSPECVSVLAAASIVGNEFSLAVVAAMVDQPVMDCLHGLDEATAAGMLVPASAPEHQRFSHALLRDAIEARLGTAERARLHRLAAEAVEEVHATRLEPQLFNLARHWEMASVLGDSARAAHWIERAGNRAMRSHASEDGAQLFRRALEVGGAHLDGAARVRVLIALGAALYLSSDLPGGLDACREAATLGAQIGRGDLVAEAALVTEPTFEPTIDIVVRQLCETAISAMGSESLALRARVLARFAQVCDYLADLGPAEAASKEALDLAERSGDLRALLAALHARQIVRSGPDGLDERAVLAERVLTLGSEAADPNEQLWGHLWRVDVAFERGDFGRAAAEIEAVAGVAQQVRGPLAKWQLLRCQAMLAQAQARFDDARRLAEEAFSAVAPTGHPAAALIRGALLMAVAHHVGYDTESLAANGIPEPGCPLPQFPSSNVIRALAPAAALVEVGRLGEAATIYRSLGAVGDWRFSPHSALAVLANGISLAVALNVSNDVATLRELLSPHRGHHVISGAGPLGYFGPVELRLGVAAAHLDLLDDAVADLEHAAKACTANGAVAYKLEAQYELGAVLASRAGPGDLVRARSLAALSARQAADLGMVPLAGKAGHLVAQLDERSSLQLTPREREVAELVGQGLTNREIAARLYLSERTAENHVQHILTKLDLANRSQIAVWVAAPK
ncbi:MAG: AAA family ATPase [Actinomycetota bacterium]|nr:AAA family ATPase [Actinomycetota bacterium]